MHQLRLLNVDDFMILRGLHEGLSVTSVGQKLGLSQPAVTQRIRKMEDVFGIKLLEKEGRGVKLSPDGRKIALKARGALALFESPESAEGTKAREGATGQAIAQDQQRPEFGSIDSPVKTSDNPAMKSSEQ